MEIADAAALVPIGGGILGAAYLFVKAGPAWNTSLIKQERERNRHLLDELEKAESKARAEGQRADRYRQQITRGETVPFDEVAK